MRSETLISVYLDSLKLAIAADRVCVQLNAAFGLEQRQFSTDEEQMCPPLPPEGELETLHVATHQFTIFRHVPSGNLFVSLTLTDPDALSVPQITSENRKPLPTSEQPVHALMYIDFGSVTHKAGEIKSETIIKHAELLSGLLLQIEVDSGLTTDAVTGLPNRLKFQNQVASAFQTLDSLCILLIHVKEFTRLNKALGKHKADKFLIEMASTLGASVRNTDIISRFGGALFAICAPIRSEKEAMNLARKLQLSLQNAAFFDTRDPLSFDIGGVVAHFHDASSSSSSAITLEFISSVMLKAEQALAMSQQQPFASINIWNESQQQDFELRAEHPVGLLTTDSATDFRNMQLIWDVANIIAAEGELSQLMNKIFKRISLSFNITAAGIGVMTSAGMTPHLTFSPKDHSGNEPPFLQHSNVKEHASATHKQQTSLVTQELAGAEYFMMPLEAATNTVMFLRTPHLAELKLPHNLALLNAVTKQVSKAYARIRAEQDMLSRLEAENVHLQASLKSYKTRVEHGHFVFNCESMRVLVERAAQAYSSHYPMVITGENGTGKRALIQAILQSAESPALPVVEIDCTKAEVAELTDKLDALYQDKQTPKDSAGTRLMTVVFNKIEALSLPAQDVLLAWLDNLEIGAGAVRSSISADSRLAIKCIATTQYDLKTRVRHGKFNKQLLRRFSQQTLLIPPLRERTEDIPLLCNHFIRRFKRQFRLTVPQITPRTLERMMAYSWPGNVKQLEAALLQACSSGKGTYIEWEDLNITDVLAKYNGELNAYAQPVFPAPDLSGAPALPTAQSKKQVNEALAELIDKLEVALAHYIDGQQQAFEPVGKWLVEQLVYQTHIHTRKDYHQGSVRLGISSSTLRRKLQQVPVPFSQMDTIMWRDVIDALHVLSSGAYTPGDGSITWLQKAVLYLLLRLKPNQLNKVALLMGMSEPTMYKLRKALRQSAFSLPV